MLSLCGKKKPISGGRRESQHIFFQLGKTKLVLLVATTGESIAPILESSSTKEYK